MKVKMLELGLHSQLFLLSAKANLIACGDKPIDFLDEGNWGGGGGTLNKFNRHGPMDFFSILLTYRCTTLGLTVSCLWWQQPHCTESVAKKYLSTWKAERNQLKRMPITSDISANNKEIFIYEMIVWAVMVWLDCPFRQLMLQKGHDYPALLKKQIIWPLSLSLFSL